MELKTTRFSGAMWADQLKQIMIIGQGGIGSWLTLNLSRIGHDLIIVDDDMVDETNVTGGQLYKTSDIGSGKVYAVKQICRDLGCTNEIMCVHRKYTPEMGMLNICVTGLDNMVSRKMVFEEWVKRVDDMELQETKENSFFMDGRLTMDMFEILAFSGDNKAAIDKYRSEYLFSDSEAAELDCTTKQSTWSAMGIASFMTSTLCNHLVNRKLGMHLYEVPFYQRMYYPISKLNKIIQNEPESISRHSES